MYVKNRTNDIFDVPILGAEEKVIGASVWVWCFGGGFQHGRRGEGFGIRGGNLGIYRTGGRGPSISVSDGDGSGLYLDQGNSFIVMNSNSHLTLSKKARYRNKNFSKYNTNILFPMGFVDIGEEVDTMGSKFCESPLSIELSIALYYGVRVGFDFSEMADLVLGLVTIDLMSDDEN